MDYFDPQEERMRIYKKNELKKIICNKCGHLIIVENQVTKEDYFSAGKVWGYFSDKDGISHSFELCEKCYDMMIEGFELPVTEEEITEFM